MEKVDAEWEVIECGTSKEWKNFKPEGSALYRVAVKGKSVYSGVAAEVSSEETVVIRQPEQLRIYSVGFIRINSLLESAFNLQQTVGSLTSWLVVQEKRVFVA